MIRDEKLEAIYLMARNLGTTHSLFSDFTIIGCFLPVSAIITPMREGIVTIQWKNQLDEQLICT